jgi:hypothetical protein
MRLVVTDQSPAPDLSESNQGADIYYEPIEHPDLDGPGLFDRWPNQDEEDQEMTNGHVVVVNDDDDSPSQGNEIWDHEDALGAKTNDARIRPFSLASLDGKWSTVKLTWQPQSKVAVYQDYGAGRSPVASGDTFEVTNLPDLFMEGLEASAAMRDTIMTASYDCEVCSDQIALTVVSADVDGDSNGDGSIDDLDDELEGSTNHPVFVSVNDNDSNGDGTNDHLNLVIDGASDLAEMTEIRVERIKPYDLPVGTVKLSGASNMRVFIADGTLVKPAAGDAASAVDLWTNLPCTLWAEGVGPGRDELTLTYRYQRSDGGTTEFSDVIQVCLLSVDLDAMKVSHNVANGELPDTDETSTGAFVPINNDDDDYDASNTADKDQSGSITGESDLLPIKLHRVEPAVAGSKYTLDIPGHVKIWQNADRSGAVSGTTELDANVDTMLYVEGTTVGSGNIKANWKNSTTTLNACDEIKVTVFDWVGAQNVPDYSIHRYTASGALGSSRWTTPVNGTIKTGAGSSDITVLWSGGPVIGKAVYQVNSDYLWDLEMNVVEIKIEAPSAGNAFTAGSPAYQGDMNFGVYGPVVSSGSPGMLWKAKITMNGPSANGVDQRGVTHIEVGFVQNLAFTTCRGDFTVSGIPQSLAANIQGNSYHDVEISQPPGQVYYFAGGNSTFKPTGTSVAARTKDPLEADDTPTAGVPLYYKKGVTLSPPNDDTLDSMHWTGTFDLWITARTDSTANGADLIYTCRADGDWVFTVNEAYPMSNPLTSSSVTVPGAWSTVTDGSTPTLTTGQTANQALAGITY